MKDTVQFINKDICGILYSGMEKHTENMSYLLHMIAILRERQSSWQLTAQERELTKRGIEALEAAKDALSTQIYA